MRSFATINATTLAAKQACKAAGLTHHVVQAKWVDLQPTSAGQALDATALAALNTQIADTINAGLRPVLEHAIQYPPAWALAAVELFKDQAANTWTSSTPGTQVRNWFWTANGQGFVADFITKVYAGLTAANVAAIDRIRLGGGYFGELQYPHGNIASPFSYWAFGAAQQTGTGIAASQKVCPLPGYTPFTGTDAQDVVWINWYLGGIAQWMLDLIAMHKTAGWTCDLMVLHPGFSVRQNHLRSDSGFRDSLSNGIDFTRMIGAYAHDPQVWPWSTWIDGTDPFAFTGHDSDQAAWKKLYSEAVVRGKHTRMWGENTGGETNAQMDAVFVNALGKGAPASGDPYLFAAPVVSAYAGYAGLMWLDYASLIAGGANASLAHYATKIAGQDYDPAKLRWRPPPQHNPTIVNVPQGFYGGTFRPDEDVIFIFPAGNRFSEFQVTGGRHVRCIGGSTVYTQSGTCMTFVGQTGSVFIEGHYCNMTAINADWLNVSGQNHPGPYTLFPNVYVQNCFVTGLNGTDATTHSDLFQSNGSVGTVNFDMFTADSNYQGISLFQDQGPVAGASISRTNLKYNAIAGQPVTYLLFPVSGSGSAGPYGPIVLDGFYIAPRAGQNISQSVAPEPGWVDNNGNPTGVVTDDNWATAYFPPAANISGKVISGAPPGGDFCPSGVPGNSYVSPGYL